MFVFFLSFTPCLPYKTTKLPRCKNSQKSRADQAVAHRQRRQREKENRRNEAVQLQINLKKAKAIVRQLRPDLLTQQKNTQSCLFERTGVSAQNSQDAPNKIETAEIELEIHIDELAEWNTELQK